MSRKVLNTGQGANDGTGDSLRTAGEKINANFEELYGLVTTEGGITLEQISQFITASVDSAMDGVDLTGVIANQTAITALQNQVNQQTIIINDLDSDIINSTYVDTSGIDANALALAALLAQVNADSDALATLTQTVSQIESDLGTSKRPLVRTYPTA